MSRTDDIDGWAKIGGVFCAVLCIVALIVPSTLVVISYNTEYEKTTCSSNITQVRVQSTHVIGYLYATVITTETGTGFPIRLWYPAFPHRQNLVGDKEQAVNAWISRISSGSPTATFPCLVENKPQSGVVTTGISSRQPDKLIGWIFAMIAAIVMIIVMLLAIGWLCSDFLADAVRWCAAWGRKKKEADLQNSDFVPSTTV
jgi:hypothetical protein